MYCSRVAVADRSRMNVTFRVCDASGNPSEALEAEFLAGAEEAGLQQLPGHRSVGGIRASLYNAVSEEAALVLRDYMVEFAAKKRPAKK